MSEVELARMTWAEVAEARDRGAVVLIPIGTHEQNGSTCPLGTDTIIAFEVARRAASHTGAVVASPLNYGYSARNRNYPGTISLRPDTLRNLILDVCEGLIGDGFDHLMFVNSHWTNEPMMEQAAREIRERHSILLGFISPMALAEKAGAELFPGMGHGHGHGDDRTASMLLSIDPDLIKMDKAAPNDEWTDFEGLPLAGSNAVKVGGGVLGVYWEVHDISKTGGNGDPRTADAERGAEMMRRVAEMAAEGVRTFATLRTTGRP